MAKFVACTKREEVANLTFEWNIEEFEDQIRTAKNGEFVELDNVSVGESKWRLKVFPNGETTNTKGAVSLYCYSLNETKTTARVTISIVKYPENSSRSTEIEERKVFKKKEYTHIFEAKKINSRRESNQGWRKFLKEEDRAKFLQNGNLLLLIKITVLGERKTTKRPSEYDFQEIETQEKLKATKRFKDSWVTNDFSDVNIKCKGEIFYCHRMILARSSPYFRRMLESGLKESQIQVIDMDHMDVDILRAVIKFIYGGEMDNLEVTAVLLLKASNMFILEDLKNICEKYLLNKYMKLDNVIDMLVMAETHNANDLKKGAMEMIASNSGAIIKQVGWKEKLSDTPKLVMEIFEAIASKNIA